MKRWKITPQADVPQGPSVSHETHVHEGGEDSLSVFLSDLQARTGTPHEATDITDGDPDAERSDEEREDEVRRQEAVHEKQQQADQAGRPIEN